MADTNSTFHAAAYTGNGTAREQVKLPAEMFDGTVNLPVMHQAVKAYLANQRQGNAKTKTRGFVQGGNQKPWKQKGTGRARQGSIRAPNWVGGGTVFGPIPRSYAQYVPRQVRALARKSALNARARENAVLIVDRFEYERPQTSRLAAFMARLELSERKVLPAHRWREGERLPLGAQPAEGARAAVLGRLGVPRALERRGADRVAGDRRGVGAGGGYRAHGEVGEGRGR